ncbi:MFS transporter [Ascobolus immersus RN42]|uniref:MFS transporter n=1 Tax=Ascobolus immersus RN42 TaxID=1160509 RepID=A0A3N4IAJ6_ASCIM|nr:MFS transporter [Ascobolus immersus RN42]
MATQAVTHTQADDGIELAPIPSSSSRKSITSIDRPGRTLSGDSSPSDPSDPPNGTSRKLSRLDTARLVSALLCFITAGINDATLGPLIPYLQKHYAIGPGLVAIVYIPSFLGWCIAGVLQTHLFHYAGQGGVLLIGAILQLASNIIRACAPVYGLFAFSFFLAGAGIALQDSQANSYVAELPHAHNWLGVIHSGYGLGCLVAPLIATSVASNTPHWNFTYLVIIALNLPNVALVGLCFRDSISLPFLRKKATQPIAQSTLTQCTTGVADGTQPLTESKNKKANSLLLAALKDRAVWQLSLFYFLHLGGTISLSGWVVEFLVEVRKGDLTQMGYVPVGFNAGLTLSRLLLPPLTHRWGEKLMVSIYMAISTVFLLVFWLVPNIVANAVALSIIGFFLGPVFATGVSVATKLIAKERVSGSLALIFVLGQAGGSLFPFLTGVIAGRAGVAVLQPIALGLIVASGVVWVMLPKVEVKRD